MARRWHSAPTIQGCWGARLQVRPQAFPLASNLGFSRQPAAPGAPLRVLGPGLELRSKWDGDVTSDPVGAEGYSCEVPDHAGIRHGRPAAGVFAMATARASPRCRRPSGACYLGATRVNDTDANASALPSRRPIPASRACTVALTTKMPTLGCKIVFPFK